MTLLQTEEGATTSGAPVQANAVQHSSSVMNYNFTEVIVVVKYEEEEVSNVTVRVHFNIDLNGSESIDHVLSDLHVVLLL